MKNHSPISVDIERAMEDFSSTPSEQTSIAVLQAFSHAVNNNEWVYIPIVDNGRGSRPLYLPNNSETYVAMYSSEKSRKYQKASSMMCGDINKIVDAVYIDPRVAGVVIDPFDAEPFVVKRKDIDYLTVRKDPRRQPRDWGKGIPAYKPNDRMTREELLDFAIEIVCDYCVNKEGFEIVDVRSGLEDIPNIAAMKNGKLHLIIVKAGVAPHMPRIDRSLKAKLLKHAEQFDATCLFASVGIGAADPERFDASLALCGDAFYANFKGFEVLEPDEMPRRHLKEILYDTATKNQKIEGQDDTLPDFDEDDPLM